MGCNPELVSAFLDGELDRVIVGAVTDHLMVCEECCRTLDKLASVKWAVSDKFILSRPEDLTSSVMSVISNDRVGPSSGGMAAFLKKVGFTVAVLCVLGVFDAAVLFV
ncbi:MAG: putative transrane anti-sigma factor [Magnetococcales bacterium]|nr:putative transrane anti-sigma factor [Magnetococcales bacterium]HIJ84794.1 zf-HC2 domain-containing protein [Magnetococcales bacterium]